MVGIFPLKTNWNNSSFQIQVSAHLDPSSTTAGFGFALGHVEDIRGHLWSVKSHVVFDIVHRWKPEDFPGGRNVDWEKVINDIVRWVDLFQPYEITFDQFQSSAPIQWLNKWLREHNMSHIRVYEKTATAQYNWNRANVFKTALYQDLVHLPNDTRDAEYSAQELKHLQQINTAGRFPRIDKQEIGPVQTKDMADCIMEVTESLIGNLLSNEMRENLAEGLAYGAPGGYQIGGRNDNLEQFYHQERGTHTFREMRPAGSDKRVPSRSEYDKVRDKLGGLGAARGGTWSARGGRGNGGGRSRGR
jgi:hypothetical protein